MKAYRAWSLQMGGLLRGSYGKTWNSSFVKSAVAPAEHNSAGIYAFPTIDRVPEYLSSGSCLGEVDLGGVVAQHADGVLRAEYCAIRWLLVLAHTQLHALRERYKVPVYSLSFLLNTLTAPLKDSIAVPLNADSYIYVGDPPPEPITINLPIGTPAGYTAEDVQSLFKRFMVNKVIHKQRNQHIKYLKELYWKEYLNLQSQETPDQGGRMRATRALIAAHQQEYDDLLAQAMKQAGL